MTTVQQFPMHSQENSTRQIRARPGISNNDLAVPRNQSSRRLIVKDLPLHTSTWDIHRYFSRYGSLVRITIREDRGGDRARTAEIDFQPEPADQFWPARLRFQAASETGPVTTIYVHEARSQKQWFPIPSPIRNQVTYHQRQEILGKCLDFGILTEPQSMTVMQSCPSTSTSRPRLLLDLHRDDKEIEVYFSVEQTSEKRSSIREFRFKIALDDALKFWRLEDDTLVIHLPRPPWYSKQLKEALQASHSKDARMWSIEDTWARQTDIVDFTSNIKTISTKPVSVQKELSFVNTARWTTFRFHISSESLSDGTATTFLDALRDWNIKIREGSDFVAARATPTLEQDTWKLIHDLGEDHSSFWNGTELPSTQLLFSVRYQLEVCLSHGYLSEYSLTREFFEQLAAWPESKAKQALVHLATSQKRLYDPMQLFTDVRFLKPVRAKRLPDNCIEIHSATVTASGLLFHTPSVEITNRVIRQYRSQAHRFLRVRFEDDAYRGTNKLFATTNNRMITVFNRVKRALTYGIRMGDVHYEFLAWGNSQLREHGVYFVASTASMSADSVRAQMGSFKETVVAKKAARMGQCFSTTRAVHLPSLQRIHADTTISDVKRGKYIFTDGVGKISELAAQLVSHELKIKGRVPSLFQFRLGGCKGVIATSKDVPGIGMQIRESQFKFDSLSGELEIIRYSQFWQPFLNRQIILVLRHLGVPAKVFLDKQNQTIQALKNAMTDDGAATKALRSNVDPNLMTLDLCELIEAGFCRSQEPFITAQLHLWRAWTLKYLKEKAKIPVTEGAFVLGCVDETASLKGHTSECPKGDRDEIMKDPEYLSKLPEIFIQITDPATNQPRIIQGLCILARNPSLHQGDIRVVRAVDNPLLRDKFDVVVMPQTGERDLPSMCSGGDLDGDDYIVIWDEHLIPQNWNAEPFHYEPEPPKTVTTEITTQDLIDFFLDYLRFDMLGRIAVAHLAAADDLDDGIESEICQELTRLHSNAVDYPKTGVPAKMERRLDRDKWPHFMEKRARTYHSGKVLGKLYDSVEKINFKPDYDLPFDQRILDALESSREQLQAMQDLKLEYDNALRRILTQHSIKSEFELWSTFVLDHSKKSRDYKFHEEVGDLSRALKEQYYEAICDVAGGRDFEHLAPFAVAAYKVTKFQIDAANEERRMNAGKSSASDNEESIEIDDVSRMPFMSFPWLLRNTLKKIALHAEDNVPRTTAVNIKNGRHVTADTNVKLDENGITAVELPSFEDLGIPKSGLLQYLPDPLRSGLTDERWPASKADPSVTEAVTEATIVTQTRLTQDNAEKPLTHDTVAADESLGETSPDQGQAAITDKDETGFFLNHDDGTISDIEEGSQSDHDNSTSTNSEADNKPIFARRERQKKTTPAMCPFWLKGNCTYSDEQCRFAHWDTGVEHNRKERVTCWFWLTTGRCSNTAESCAMAHRDTGVTMPPPMFKTRFDSAIVATDRARHVWKTQTHRPAAPSSEKRRARQRAVTENSDDEDKAQSPLPRNRSSKTAVQRDGTLDTRKRTAFTDLAELELHCPVQQPATALARAADKTEAVAVQAKPISPTGVDTGVKDRGIANTTRAMSDLRPTAFSYSPVQSRDANDDSKNFPAVSALSKLAIDERGSSQHGGTDDEENDKIIYGDPLHNDEIEIEELSD